MEKTYRYFKANPTYNSAVHMLAGMGIGILITYPYIGSHPVRYGVAFLAIGVLGHLYPLFRKK